MKALKAGLFTIGSLAASVLVGCGKDSKPFDAPLVKPPVDEATPAGLQASSAALALTQSSQTDVTILAMSADKRLQRLLTQQKGAINGGNCNGVVGCALQALDFRVAEVNKRTEESVRTCVGAATTDYTLSLLGESLTLKVQCNDIFADNGVHGDESGLVFGKADSVFSIGMTLDQSDGMFTYVANYDSVADKVDYLETSYWEQGSNYRTTMLRLVADRNDKTFELAYGGVADGTGLHCGIQMRSDGNHIFFKGKVITSNDEKCSDLETTTLCVNAADLSTVSGTCSVTESKLTLTAIDSDKVSGGLADMKAAMGAKTHWTGVGVDFNKSEE